MTSREGRTALEHLRELLDSDLTQATPETLAAGIRQAELLFDQAQVWGGRLITELRSRELTVPGTPTSWADVARRTDIAPSTLRQRVKKFDESLPSDG